MFENMYPLFNGGRLLKIEMLEELRDFPREFFNITLKEYSDGIISGCDIEIKDDSIEIKKGIVKYNNVIYILKEDISINYAPNNKLMILKLRFLPEKKHEDYIDNATEFHLDQNLNLADNEMEICRFKLRTGASLRIKHVNFCDLSTEYDTVNTINAPYAAYGESSLNPEILRTFGRELLKCNLSEAWDISFGMTCIQSINPVQKEIIVSYLRYKLNIENKDYSNEELYYYLLEVLNSVKSGEKGTSHQGRGRYKKILID